MKRRTYIITSENRGRCQIVWSGTKWIFDEFKAKNYKYRMDAKADATVLFTEYEHLNQILIEVND